jgi:PAS domain S-box-containing protein
MVSLPDGLNWLPTFALDRVSDFVIITDSGFAAEDGPHMVYVNRALIDATGYSEEELIGRSPRIFQGPDTDRDTLSRIKNALLASETVSAEVLNYTKSGRPYWSELNIAPIRDDAGTVVFFVSIQRDVTAQRLLTETHEVERQLFAAGEKIGDIGTWRFDVGERRVLWSDGAYKVFGLENAQAPMTVEDHLSFLEPADRAAMTALMDRCIDKAIPFEREVAGTSPDGERLHLAIRGEALKDGHGETIAVVGAIRDVTAQRQLREALNDAVTNNRKMERQFANARLAAKIGIFDYSVGHDLQFWSDELLEMTGLSGHPFPAPAEAFVTGIDPADRPLFDKLLARAIECGESYNVTVRFHRPDGRCMHMNIIAEVQDVSDDRRIIGIARDVTEEVEASALLKLQEERFQIIAETVSDVLWDYEIEKDVLWVSPNWPEKLGLADESSPFVAARWVDFVAKKDREPTWASLLQALKSDSPHWRFQFGLVDARGAHADVEINAAIMRHSNGRAYRMLGNLRNVTQEKLQQEGLTRSRALEAVGQMTGGVAHDFNNLLMIIQGNAELLALSTLNDEDRESIQLITKASEAAANLTARLLSFSGQTRLNNSSINVRELLSDLLPLLKSGLTSVITIKHNIPEDIWNIEVDANALEQAIINLAVNARDAMPMGGTIELIARNEVVSDQMVGADCDLAPGRYICISISDNGEGMTKDVISKACEPFFTTKDVGKGTGLGLSSVYGFVRQSGGALQIYSELGHGSTIKLYFPVSKTTEFKQHTANQFAAETLVYGRRVLVVEDQPEVRSHVEKLLVRAGFEVATAEHGQAAIDLLAAGEHFDVLFTDIVMPGGINGVQLAERATQITPGVKVLFTSGFPASAFEEVGVNAWEGFDLLQKPYKAADLINAIRALG